MYGCTFRLGKFKIGTAERWVLTKLLVDETLRLDSLIQSDEQYQDQLDAEYAFLSQLEDKLTFYDIQLSDYHEDSAARLLQMSDARRVVQVARHRAGERAVLLGDESEEEEPGRNLQAEMHAAG